MYVFCIYANICYFMLCGCVPCVSVFVFVCVCIYIYWFRVCEFVFFTVCCVSMSSILGGINFMCTVKNLRSSSITFEYISLFVWSVLLQYFC